MQCASIRQTRNGHIPCELYYCKRAILPYIMYNDGSSFKRKTIELVTANQGKYLLQDIRLFKKKLSVFFLTIQILELLSVPPQCPKTAAPS